MAAKWEQTAMSINPELQIGDKSFTGGMTPEELAAAIVKGWDNDPGKGAPEGEKLLWDIQMIGIRVGTFAHGEDFLTEAGAPEHIIKEYRESMRDAIAQATAKKLGMDDYKPLLLESITEEQKKVMAEIAAEGERNRLFFYLATNYRVATEMMLLLLAEEIGTDYETITDREDWADISNTVAFLVRYFFARHGEHRADGVDEIDPLEKSNMTDSQREELHDMIKKLVAYRQQHDGGFYENIAPCFALEKSTTEQSLESITEITQKDSFGLPVSKVWRKQREIGLEGREGQTINVGRKTIKGAVIVSASISDKEGNPINIDGWSKSVQRGIGNLIDEAGGKAALPINVTPQQIYRATLRAPSSSTVTRQQVEQVHAAMNILMYSPATLDFTAQIEKHKNIRQQSDIDYDEAQLKRQAPALVMAYREKFILRGQLIEDGYKILAYPLFYEYSHAINQIANVPNRYLTGPEKPAIKETEKADARKNTKNTTMMEIICTKVLGMKQQKKSHKQYSSHIRIDDIAKECNIELNTEKIRRTLRKNISLYLDFLKNEGTISGFEEIKERREIVGYAVKL